MFQNPENCTKVDDDRYDSANYYSDKIVAENNTRADTLMRQLRRFAVEHREESLNFDNDSQRKFYIWFNYVTGCIRIETTVLYRDFGAIYFDNKETALAAIEAFHDELTWYFMKYKDSL